MKFYIRRSCLSFIVLSALIKAIQSSENDTDTNETRQGRVNGRIVKLYSGTKPDPVMCHNEGFKADPRDCSIFYRCVHSYSGKFNVFRFQCGPGTVYDPETEVCNHPSNTKRSECSGAIASSNLEMDGNDINFQELPSPITTTPELNSINATGNSIVVPETVLDRIESTTNINTLVTTTTDSQQLSGAYDISGIYSWENKNNRFTKGPSHSTKPPGIEQYNPCTIDGFVGDRYDCKKFYRCVNNFRGGFTRYEFVCSDATVWDDVKQSCNYPWAVRSRRCGRDSASNNIVNDFYTPGVDKDKTTSNYNDLTAHNQNYNIIMEKNPNANHYGEKINNVYNSHSNPISNNIDQSKLNTTNTYNLVTTSYPSGNMVTDSNLVPTHVTETPYNYNFSEATESQKQDVEIKKDINMSPIISPSTENTLSMSSIIDSVKLLNNICTQSGFIGDPNDCQKFYRCVDNGQGSFKKYEFSCSQGTVWDSEIEACNHAWAVKECSNTAFNQTLSVEGNGINGISSENNAEPEDTNNIDSDYGYPNQIIEDGMKTSTSKIETTFFLPSTSGDTNTKTSCSSSGFFINSVDCSKFYRCVENGKGSYTRYDYNCGEGTLWDETIEACNHAWAVKSCKSSIEGSLDTGIMTTVTFVQTTTQENIDDNDYDSIYGSQQSTTSSSKDIEVSATTSKQPLHANGSECSADGFIGDNTDSKKFYRCVDNGHGGYTRYEFSCGDGTIWDPTIEACNFDSEVKDFENSSNNNSSNNVEPATSTEDIEAAYETSNNQYPNKPGQSTLAQGTTTIGPSDNNECESLGFMGDSDDCEKFYRCIDNGKGGYDRIEFKCAEGTVWDSSIEACNHRWAVEKCGKNSNNEFSQTTSNAMITDSGTSFVPTKPPEYLDSSNQQTSTEKSSGSKDLCLSEGFFGSSKGDCNKFYRCVGNGEGSFTKYDFKCGDGTNWDDNIKACNHASDNNTCRSSSSKPQTDTPSSTHAVEPTTPISTTTIQYPSHPHENECTSEGFIANPSDCQKFIRCVDDGKGGYTKFDFSCGEGTIWIQEIQACDHNTDGISCNRQNITSTSSSTEIETSTTSTKDENTENMVISSSSTTQSSVKNDNNNNNCEEEGFYPNKNDCQRFYRCVNDEKGSFAKYEFTCVEGTAWDTLTQSCNYIDQVSSCKNNNIPEAEIEPESNNDTVTGIQQNTTTLSPPPSTTTTNHSNESTCNEAGFFGDKEDCKKFYRCVSNDNKEFTKYEFTCGDGTMWDQDILACNHPNDVSNLSCKLDGELSTMSSTSTTTIASSNTENTSSPPTTSKSSTPGSTAIDNATTKKDSNNSSCSDSNSNNASNQNYTCTRAGFYADQNDCKKFYRCVDWGSDGEKFSIYHFECGDGTIWDPALETCNHEDSVYPPRNCNGKEQENQTNSPPSSTTKKSTTTLTETESTSSITETEPTSSTTPDITTQTSTTTSSTTESKPTSSTTESKPTSTTTVKSTTQPSTTKSTTTQISTAQTSTTIRSTSSESSTQQSSTTNTLTTNESSMQQSTTTNSDVSTTESSSQTSTDITESTTSASSTPDDSTTMITQTSTTEPSSTTEITTSSEDISSQTTESQSTTKDSTTVTNSQDSSTESSTADNKDCPDTEEDQYLYVCPTSFKRHPKYCNMFYQCTEDNDNHEVKVAVFNCPNNTIYDENKIQCVEEKQATKKCNGQISQKNRIKRLGADFNEPIVASEDSMRCLEAGHFPFEKRDQCSPALLKCEYTKSGQLRGYVYKCPEGFLYWTISRRCEAVRKVRDCKLPSYNWKKRYDIPVERYNIGH